MSARPEMSPIDHARRCRAVVDTLTDRCDALLFTDLVDVRWLTGFTGSHAWVVVRREEIVLGTDLRYRERAAAETAPAGVSIVAHRRRDELHGEMLQALSGASCVGVDASTITHDAWTTIAQDVAIEPTPSVVKMFRRIKDDAEIERIAAAAAATDLALAEVEPMLLDTIDRPISEADIRTELEYRMRLHGADDRSYDTIVATGPEHAARPHHEASARTIVEGDTVIIDVGGLVDGYHSDMTRSWVIGDPTPQQREIHDLVAASQDAGLAATKAGVTATSVDDACRGVFDDAGYLDWYLHGTGHGVGLEIHETPFHNQTSRDELASGMVVTIEPGLYRDGFGGFRIEDLVVVTDTGHRVLTHSPKRPIV